MTMKSKLLSRVFIDKIIYKPSARIKCSVFINNPLNIPIKGILTVEVIKERKLVYSLSLLNISIEPKSSRDAEFTLLSPRKEGIYTLKLMVDTNNSEIFIGSISFAVGDPTKRNKLYVAFVWHNHQAPNYRPDGVYHSLWAFLHTYADEFLPYYQGGAYLVHTCIMLKHPSIKVTYHLSPSLLYQWKQAIEKGYKTTPYIIVKSPDPRISRIKEAFENYMKLLNEKRIEILTSFFAHPIAGFLIKRFSKDLKIVKDILLWEMKEGLNITSNVMKVSPRGVWCPEMFWDMELISLFYDSGIRYTVLCEQHFKLSKGRKATIYEPYIVEDLKSGKSIIVFFRDRELSDWLGFKNNMPTLDDVDNNLRSFMLALYRRYLSNPGKVVVIALDGENWMIMSKFPLHTAVFLDKLYKALEEASDYFKTVTLAEALEKVPPRRELTYVPWGSWIGLTTSQWTGGVKDELWKLIESKLKIIVNIIRSQKIDEKILKRIYEAMAIAMDSDYFWYGEEIESQNVIKMWANYVIDLVKEKSNDVVLVNNRRTNNI